MFGVPPAIIGMLRQMGAYLQQATARAAVGAAAGKIPDPDELSGWLNEQMSDWDPTIKGRKLADPATRQAAARFLSGVAINLITGAAK